MPGSEKMRSQSYRDRHLANATSWISSWRNCSLGAQQVSFVLAFVVGLVSTYFCKKCTNKHRTMGQLRGY